MTASRVRIVVASVAAVLMVAALSATVQASPARGATARAATTTVRAVGSAYASPHWSPKRVSIDHRNRVKWLAVSYDHVLVAYGGNWTFHHRLPQGASVVRRFAHAGTYLFRCTVHSTLVNDHCQGMCGKLVVH